MAKPEFRIYSFPVSESLRLQIPISEEPCVLCIKKQVDCYCRSFEENIGKSEGYSIEELDLLKSQLDGVRSELNSIDIEIWQDFTRSTNIAQDIIYKLRNIPIELPTTGWCKLYEILSFFRWYEMINENEYRSMHLCECPGGFISALNHYIHNNVLNKRQRQNKGKILWEWKANSLNPYYEGHNPYNVLNDDIIYRDTYRVWNMGIDDSGDITNCDNIHYIWSKTSKNTKSCWLADLVTADGSIDTQYNPNEQEQLTSCIQYCEVVCGLGILRKHGSLIVKCFNIFHHTTISLLALLYYCFNQVHIVKPVMSKGGNSEVYIVALNFQGIRSILLKSLTLHFKENKSRFNDIALLPREWVPQEFIKNCVTAGTLFCKWQIDYITRNLIKFRSFILDNNVQKRRLCNGGNKEFEYQFCDIVDSDDEKVQKKLKDSLNTCSVSKKERRLFALEYIQKLDIRNISPTQYILPNRDTKSEFRFSTSLSRKGGDRNRVQGIYIDRQYAFKLYEDLQKTRSKLYFPLVSYRQVAQKLNTDGLLQEKLLYWHELLDNSHNLDQDHVEDYLESELNTIQSSDLNTQTPHSNNNIIKIPIKKEISVDSMFTKTLPLDKYPKGIKPNWLDWSKDDTTYQRLMDRVKSQVYMFETDHFFNKVQSFPSFALQMSPYCNDDIIRRYCETIIAVNTPLRNISCGIDTFYGTNLYHNKEGQNVVLPFDFIKFLGTEFNNSHNTSNSVDPLIDNIISVNDYPLYSQIPANRNIVALFESLCELNKVFGNSTSMTEYLAKRGKYLEIYNGTFGGYYELFPLSYIMNIISSEYHGTILIVSDLEGHLSFVNNFNEEKSSGKNIPRKQNDKVRIIDISKEIRFCSQYKQVLNAVTSDYMIQKFDYDLIFIDPFCHIIPTYSIGQFEIECHNEFVSDLMIALNMIRLGGDMVVVLKSCLTRFTAGLLLILSLVFDKIGIHRPLSCSSPLLSSMHLLCSGYNDSSNSIARHFLQYLWDVSFVYNKEKLVINQCVPPTLFASDYFLKWLRDINQEFISQDIDLWEAVIEQQGTSEDTSKDGLYSWTKKGNITNIQRETLRFILLGNISNDIDINNYKNNINEKAEGEMDLLENDVDNFNSTNISGNCSEKIQADVCDLLRKSESIVINSFDDNIPNNEDIDPFEENTPDEIDPF
ncbi:ribosomal RNA large subunit methyltransferase J domain-containing protein [Cryptosporidium muris RN66]|uniref:Cap-specific mRNA (nucleoside-2'-O-)-methyltransferase 2 n=1 Tax=Cryptosporidium muris (strain RN66) TaxID=441375 RepID=B6AFT9_CRYMR|nr:ribosomal RNA large subunit methyltransferase J domain-containing protein [Cryptosporidium muris RN66]EEA07080.1 ribosomal RNA large subunit methyltransferase J domain-containing protein [Cryptosporidium muris RN66]|eukprot:XP_002141429.1 ribosomal RNA large subunit methyltransferase J domain-containing protein [Cryptosporidium muris RN66]